MYQGFLVMSLPSLSVGYWNVTSTIPSMTTFSQKCVAKQDWIGDGYCDDALNNKGSVHVHHLSSSSVDVILGLGFSIHG